MKEEQGRKPGTEFDTSRRDFLRKAAYTAPVILTLTAMPALAKAGSMRSGLLGNNGNGNGGGTAGNPNPPGQAVAASKRRGGLGKFMSNIRSALRRMF
jgi:hypothetical protein